MSTLNYGPRAERFAMRPLEKDYTINVLEGAVRSGKTWSLIPKILYACEYPVGGRKVLIGVSKQSVYNNVLTDLLNLVGPNNYSYNKSTGQLKLFGSEWLVIGAKDEGSERYIRGITIGIAICDELSLMPQSFFQMLLTRMSPKGARLYGTTNPDSPYHWLMTDYLNTKTYVRSIFYGPSISRWPIIRTCQQSLLKRRSACIEGFSTNGLSKAFGSWRKA